jgi:hypothetical protein
MLDPAKLVTIRRLYFAEHWRIGTIASELGVHRDTVRAAIETDPLGRPGRLREVTRGCLREGIHRPCTDVQMSSVPVLSSLVLT